MRAGILRVEKLEIEGVKLIKLEPRVDERGFLIEVLRCDDEYFLGFGQMYLTTCYPGVVKAWHAHRKQTDNFFVVKGNVKVGLHDGREDSPSYGKNATIILGEQNTSLLQIPPMIWHGYTTLGGEMSYLINVPTEPYNHKAPDELRVHPFENDFNFNWEIKSG
jgi:dTDP-4-dehydrorhamnose 3,5-epimerase